METRIDEIASGVYRLSIFAPETAPPAGLTYNHFLISGDEPLLFHCGKRKMFPLVSAAVARISQCNCCAGLLSDISRRTNADQ
jgi:flavorubredoxin